MTEEKQLEGLGGWLALVGVGIIFGPVRIIIQLFPIYSELFSNGSWEILTTPGSAGYHPLWAPILVTEIVINAGLIIASIYAGFLFFTKKRIFPKIYIGLLIFTAVFTLADAFSIRAILPEEPIFDGDTTANLARSFIAALIWVPYMFVSKRVKATFVK